MRGVLGILSLGDVVVPAVVLDAPWPAAGVLRACAYRPEQADEGRLRVRRRLHHHHFGAADQVDQRSDDACFASVWSPEKMNIDLVAMLGGRLMLIFRVALKRP